MLGDTVVVVSAGRFSSSRVPARHVLSTLVGEHGWKKLTAAGVRREHPVPQTASARLGLRVSRRGGVRFGAGISRSSALRVCTPAHGDERRARWSSLPRAVDAIFERDGCGSKPLTAGSSFARPSAARARWRGRSLQREPRDTLPVYLGDDIGDEHASACCVRWASRFGLADLTSHGR